MKPRLLVAHAIAMMAASELFGPALKPPPEPRITSPHDPEEDRRRIEAAEAKRLRRQQKRLRQAAQ